MKEFNNIEDYPVPEGLEFQESYMQDAFAMYDAEKQKRKRRLLIWWIISATGFATVLLTGIYFFAKGPIADSEKGHPVAEKNIPVKNIPAPRNSATSAKDLLNEQKPVKTNELNSTSGRNSKTVKSVARLNLNTAPTRTESKGNRRIKSTSEVLVRSSRKNADGTAIVPDISSSPKESDPNQIKTQRSIGEARPKYESTSNDQSDSLLPIDLPELAPKRAQLAFREDSVMHSIDLQTPESEADLPVRKNQVYINLGVNTLFGMKELKNRLTFRECIGVSYNYQINPKWNIGTGLEYHSISRISYKRKVGDTTDSDNTTTILNKTTLNYISFLPQVSYQLGAKHRLTAGLGIEYLLTDPGERYEIQNFTSENSSRTNSKLYYSTFNRFNYSASIGYAFQFSRFMSIHALYHFGFTDITKNSDLNSTFDRNSRLQLMLKIKLY